MSKYFTKYLPVEGEIKEGDVVPNWTTEGYTIVNVQQAEAANELRFKKVKLFLCSRDIQVGDTVQDKDGVEFFVDENRYNLMDKENGHLQLLVFKVIGEISSEATWVKEGDEFDEDQIDIYDVSHLPINVCHIKCPTCGSFH